MKTKLSNLATNSLTTVTILKNAALSTVAVDITKKIILQGTRQLNGSQLIPLNDEQKARYSSYISPIIGAMALIGLFQKLAALITDNNKNSSLSKKEIVLITGLLFVAAADFVLHGINDNYMTETTGLYAGTGAFFFCCLADGILKRQQHQAPQRDERRHDRTL